MTPGAQTEVQIYRWMYPAEGWHEVAEQVEEGRRRGRGPCVGCAGGGSGQQAAARAPLRQGVSRGAEGRVAK
eukprot:6129386-Lingulodinium_polyedra.AAC.1